MWRRLSVLSTTLPFVGLTMLATPVRAADPAEMQQLLQQLQERIRVLEERLEDDDKVSWGMGASLDQLLTQKLGVFGRAGFSRTEGESRTAYAVSTGLHLASPFGERPRDHLGVGYTFQHELEGDEHLAEAYYNLFLTDYLSVIGNVQWLFSGPNQETGKTNRDVIIPGLRTVVGF